METRFSELHKHDGIDNEVEACSVYINGIIKIKYICGQLAQ